MGKQSREKWERREGAAVEKRKNFGFLSGSEEICLSIIRWGTYLLLFTPLIIHKSFFFPFVAPKTAFFRMVVEIILLAYVFLAISHRRYRPRLSPLVMAVALFLVIFILASFAGINLERSFWSTYERMTGIWTMLHLFAFFIILGSCFKRREDWEKFLGVSVIVGVLLSIYVLKGSEVSTRGGGTIGNTSFMAAYLLFDIFFAIILFLIKRRWWQVFAGVSSAIMLPVLFTSSCRGAITAFWLGIFLLGIGYLTTLFYQKKIFKRTALAVVLILMILATVSIVFQPSFIKNEITTTLKQMGPRFAVWETGLKGFQERPILGWGPENFNAVFLKYFNSCMPLSEECGGEVWFDRVHNIVFDTLVTVGLVGFLSYLFIFGVAIYGVLKILPKIVEKRNIFLPLGIAVLLVVYFLQNLLVFDMINTYLMFFLCLALLTFLLQKPLSEEEPMPAGRVHPLFGAIVIAATIFFLWAGNIQPARAGYSLVKMLSAQNLDQASRHFQKSLDSWMNKYETREYFTQKLVSSSYQATDLSDEERVSLIKAFELGESEMVKSCQINSLDFRHRLFLGELYNAFYRVSRDEGKNIEAEKVLDKAIQLSPTNQQGYWQLSETKVTRGDAEDAISLLQKAVALDPRVGISHWYLAMAYRILGQNQLAKEQIIEAKEKEFYFEDSLTNLQRAIDVYYALKDDEGLISLYSKALELAPDNAELWASLAASYANLGEFEKAREAANKVKEIDPEMAAKVEEFLKDIMNNE